MCKFLKDLAFRGPHGPHDNLLYLFSRPRYFVGPRYKGRGTRAEVQGVPLQRYYFQLFTYNISIC